MSFGIQSFIKGTLIDSINSVDDDFVIDVFSALGSGTQTYEVPSGYQLDAVVVAGGRAGHTTYGVTTITISGNSVTWNSTGIDSTVLPQIIVSLRNV